MRTIQVALCIQLIVGAAASTGGGWFHKSWTASPSFTTIELPTTTTNVTGDVATIPEWKQNLPYPLSNKTKTLRKICMSQNVEIYLLGTAHVSNDSSSDVKLLLEAVRPNVIFLELCDQRTPLLFSKKHVKNESAIDEPKKSFFSWLRKPKAKKPTGERSIRGFASSLMSKTQQDFAESLGVELGGEFCTAYDYWEAHRLDRGGVHLILGDRPLHLTLTRAWESLTAWGKCKLVCALIVSSLKKPKPEELRKWMQDILQDDNDDLLTKSITELADHFPTLVEVIIKERDAYLACKLYQTSHHLEMAVTAERRQLDEMPLQEPLRIVAVVGAGHIQGICRWLTSGNGETPEAILSQVIQIKQPLPEDYRQMLIHDTMSLNYELLQQIIAEQRAAEEDANVQ